MALSLWGGGSSAEHNIRVRESTHRIAAAAAGKNCCQCFSQKKLFILIKLFRGEAYSVRCREQHAMTNILPRKLRRYDDEFF